jgi:hypothetical protein
MANIKHRGVGPDHLGRTRPDTNPGRSLARSHAPTVEVAARHGDRPNIARDAGKGKTAYDLKIHGGMTTQTKSGGAAFGGDHKSAIDSLSGQSTVPGKPGQAALAHPLVTPPTAKNLRPVVPTWGMKSRGPLTHADAQTIGRAMLDDAVCDQGTKNALGYGRGSK